MAEITWTSEALSRLREIHEYIAVDNPRSASKVVAGIYAPVQLLRTFPELGQRYELITEAPEKAPDPLFAYRMW